MATLQPFGGIGPAVTLEAVLTRVDGVVSVAYSLAGALETLVIPPLTAPPERCDELWTTTCLELFLGVPGVPGYVEFNFSPSGDWAAYAFDDHREGMRPLEGIATPSIVIVRTAERLHLTASVDLAQVFSPSPLEASLTAVIEAQDGEQTFWALAHPGPDADFHFRPSFVHPL